MGGPGMIRKALLAGGALAVTLAAASFAGAQVAGGSVSFADPATLSSDTPALNLEVRDDAAVRFAPGGQNRLPEVHGPRRLELQLSAGGGDAPVDVSLAQRATLGADANGDLDRRGSGSELRVGRNLVERRGNAAQGGSSVYMFVASDNEALTWRPGARSEFGGRGEAFALQEQVEVGDMSAGVTYERNGVQASLAYVEREESTRIGNESYRHDQSFTGITVTMRR